MLENPNRKGELMETGQWQRAEAVSRAYRAFVANPNATIADFPQEFAHLAERYMEPRAAAPPMYTPTPQEPAATPAQTATPPVPGVGPDQAATPAPTTPAPLFTRGYRLDLQQKEENLANTEANTTKTLTDVKRLNLQMPWVAEKEKRGIGKLKADTDYTRKVTSLLNPKHNLAVKAQGDAAADRDADRAQRDKEHRDNLAMQKRNAARLESIASLDRELKGLDASTKFERLQQLRAKVGKADITTLERKQIDLLMKEAVYKTISGKVKRNPEAYAELKSYMKTLQEKYAQQNRDLVTVTERGKTKAQPTREPSTPTAAPVTEAEYTLDPEDAAMVDEHLKKGTLSALQSQVSPQAWAAIQGYVKSRKKR
jgi:hypothetical protein